MVVSNNIVYGGVKVTIDEAIKLLTRWQDGGDITSSRDVNRAVKLGIEALRREREHRRYPAYYGGLLLPGEAEG